MHQTQVGHSLSPGGKTISRTGVFFLLIKKKKVVFYFLIAARSDGHDDFMRNVIYSPLPKRHSSLGKPFLCGDEEGLF